MTRRTILVVCALVAFALVGVSVAQASDWPQTGYDGGHSTFNRAESQLSRRSVASLELGWWRPMRPPDGAPVGYEYGTSVDVVRDGRVFASWNSDDVSRLAAFRESDGHLLWRRTFEGEWARVVAVTATTGIAQVGRRVLGFDPATGSRRWGHDVWRAGAADLRGGVVLGRSGGSGDVEAIEIRSGDVRWSRALDGASDPLVSGGNVLLTARGPAGRQLVALDPVDGRIIWRRPVVGAMELAFGGRVLTTWASDRTPVRLYGSDGRLLWRRSFDSNVWITSAGGGRVYVERRACAYGCEGDAWGTYRGVLIALSARSGDTVWRVRGGPGIDEPVWMVGALAPGLVFATDLNFGAVDVGAFASADGRRLWRVSVGSSTGSNVTAAANGRVYVGTGAGYALGGSGGRVYVFSTG